MVVDVVCGKLWEKGVQKKSMDKEFAKNICKKNLKSVSEKSVVVKHTRMEWMDNMEEELKACSK